MAETVMGLGPEDCIMVGDNYKSDICGAMEAGWQGIWFNRKKSPCRMVVLTHW
ncbi:MAG: HAD hydrolase-like protein [Lachnospiraceae bacterium]